MIYSIAKIIRSCLIFIFISISTTSCDSNHQQEFYSIQRDDINGYKEFIRKYPNSIYVKDASERIEAEELYHKLQEEKKREEDSMMRIESQYLNNSLSNGSQPYSKWYGDNQYFDNYTPHSEIKVLAPSNSDVIVIVRHNNKNGSVAGHCYIKSGMASTISLRNGYYQVFFYYGNGWYPDKNIGNVRGGFVKGESFSKDGSPQNLDNVILTYELTLQQNGNFSTSSSSEGEMF